MPPVTPSAISMGHELLAIQSFDLVTVSSIFSTAFVITSCCATVVFLCSPTATRGVEPASSWRARAPAVTTNSNEFGSLRSVNHENVLTIVFGRAAHALQPRPLGDDDAAQPIDGGGRARR